MKKFLSLLLLLSVIFFFACGPDSNSNKDDDDPDDIDTPVVPVEPDTPKKPDTPDKPEKPYVFTRPDLGNDGINEGKDYGWNVGELGGLTETITGNVSSAQYFYAQGLDAGWNLGNTYDLSSNPRTNHDELFAGVRAQGFTIVRIPITWGSNIGASPTYTVTTSWMDQIAVVVDAAHGAGLAVIINTHHDNNTWPLPSSTASGTYNTATAKFTALWQQVAERFKDYGAWLIFEPVNEPRNGGNWNGDPNGTMYAVINNWNQVFVNTVRATGGNNEHRYLMVKQYSAKPGLVMERLQIPTDSSPKKLILDFHYYDPEALCLDGAIIDWNAEDHGSLVRYKFEDFYGEFYQEGLPIIIGECGVSYQGASSNAAVANASRYEYLEFMGRAARENGITPILWDNGVHSNSRNDENFGLFNRTTGAVNSTFSKAAIDAFIKGIRE